jgi:hypothetical protein
MTAISLIAILLSLREDLATIEERVKFLIENNIKIKKNKGSSSQNAHYDFKEI